MKISWSLFDGIQPRLEPHLLKQEAAQKATNTKLWSGGAEPFKVPLLAKDTGSGTTKVTIYRYGQDQTDENYWFALDGNADFVRGLVAADTTERIYWTLDGNAPRVSNFSLVTTSGPPYPVDWYTLGLPAPAQCSISSPSGSGTPTEIAVVYVYVTGWGETGPPSQASTLIDYYDGETLTVSSLATAPAGDYNVVDKHIYIAAYDANGVGAFRFWKTVSAATTSTTGTVDFSTLGEAVASPSLIAPPTDLFGLMSHPSGFMCGFSGQDFRRSEVFKPYGWPIAYRDPLPDKPVGGAVMGSSVVICTKGKTYLFTGTDPLNMVPQDLEGWQPCVSKRSIKKTTAGVVYASADGLVLVSGSGPLQLLTANHFRRDQWQAYKPESSHAEVHDDRYFWWWDTGTTRGLLIFELGAGGVQMVVESDVHATAAFADHRKDTLYIALAADGDIYKWDEGASNTTMTWRSKLFYLPHQQNIGAARVRAAAYPVTFKLFSEGTEIDSVSVADNQPFTLPGDKLYEDFFIQVSGTNRITLVEVGSSITDLRGG